MLSTAKSPVTFKPPVRFRSDPSNVKLASSSSSPLAPAITTLLLVKSLTAKLPAVAVVILPVVAFTVALVVVPAFTVVYVAVVPLMVVTLPFVAFTVAPFNTVPST